eukprot:m.28447 g.28447  ORF g.28447 m.28447 type:complete len:293 (+) comp11839_c0_seq2:107-985(+)
MAKRQNRSKRGNNRVPLPSALTDVGFVIRAGSANKDVYERVVCVWLLPDSHPVTSNDQVEVLFETGRVATMERNEVEQRIREDACLPFCTVDEAKKRLQAAANPDAKRKAKPDNSKGKPDAKRGKASKTVVKEEEVEDEGENTYEEEFEVDCLLDKRVVRQVQYRVRWKGDWGKDTVTWENVDNVDNNLAETFEMQRRQAGLTEVIPREEVALKKQLLIANTNVKELTWRLKLLLGFLEPPAWRSTGQGVQSWGDERLPQFPVADFMDVYTRELNSLIATKVTELVTQKEGK